MKLLDKIKNFFGGNSYDFGASVRSYRYIQNLIRGSVFAWENGEQIELSDRYRMIMTKEGFEGYAFHHHEPNGELYGSIIDNRGKDGDSVPDCDEFSIEGQYNLVVKGLLAERLTVPIAFGRISYYSRVYEGWHSSNIVILTDDQGVTLAWIFEPQNGKLKEFSAEVGTVRSVRI